MVVALNSDLDVSKRVQNLLGRRAALRSVQIDVEQGTVVLSGVVTTFYDRQLCISGAKRVPGVRRIVDQLAVSAG